MAKSSNQWLNKLGEASPSQLEAWGKIFLIAFSILILLLLVIAAFLFSGFYLLAHSPDSLFLQLAGVGIICLAGIFFSKILRFLSENLSSNPAGQNLSPSLWRRVRAWVVIPVGLVFWLIAVGADISGLAGTLLWPFELSAHEPPNPRDPFSSFFTLRHTGWLSVNTIEIQCQENKSQQKRGSLEFDSRTASVVKPQPNTLKPRESCSFQCPRTEKRSASSVKADLSILVSARFSYIFLPIKQEQRFIFIRGRSGSSQWYEHHQLEGEP